MIYLKDDDYRGLKHIFEQYNSSYCLDGAPGFISANELDSLFFIFGNYPKEQQYKIAYEYMLLAKYLGDKFDDHFKCVPVPHYWKTESGMYLGLYTTKKAITTFEMASAAERLTRKQVEDSDFDFNKVKICDEEFQ